MRARPAARKQVLPEFLVNVVGVRALVVGAYCNQIAVPISDLIDRQLNIIILRRIDRIEQIPQQPRHRPFDIGATIGPVLRIGLQIDRKAAAYFTVYIVALILHHALVEIWPTLEPGIIGITAITPVMPWDVSHLINS